MGLYAKYVLPRIIDLAMRNKEATRLREEWIPRARGEVLEIGIGSGLNLPFYSGEVERIFGLDPSLELQRIARRKPLSRAPVEFLAQSAEEPLPLGESTIDTIVVTWSLCSIPDALKALRQVKRALKPGGHLLFIEHGRAADRGVAEWQDRLTPIWKRIAGGCHLNRKIDDIISEAGFRITEVKTFYTPGPRPMTYTYQGLAESTDVGARRVA